MKDSVKKYYGQTLTQSGDLKSDASCCSCDSGHVEPYAEILELIDDEILSKYYGCGSPLPPFISGCNVLDLGCGTGRDAYLASKLVGADGYVIGVDMTPQQLEVARKHLPSQMAKFGYDEANIEFKSGDIEDLGALGIADASQDVVVSNCVINLSTDKKKVFQEVFRGLKPGGELFFADIFTDRRVPDAIRTDPMMYNECLGGTLYLEDFRRLVAGLGYPDYRVVSRKEIEIRDPVIKDKVGEVRYFALTIRLFKIEDLEDTQEDYGQTAEFLCSEQADQDLFDLDESNTFISYVPTYISSNTARILRGSRYSGYFEVVGDEEMHFGRFDQLDAASSGDGNVVSSVGGCCGAQGSGHGDSANGDKSGDGTGSCCGCPGRDEK